MWPPLWTAPRNWNSVMIDGNQVEWVESRVEIPLPPWNPFNQALLDKFSMAIVGKMEASVERHDPAAEDVRRGGCGRQGNLAASMRIPDRAADSIEEWRPEGVEDGHGVERRWDEADGKWVTLAEWHSSDKC